MAETEKGVEKGVLTSLLARTNPVENGTIKTEVVALGQFLSGFCVTGSKSYTKISMPY